MTFLIQLLQRKIFNLQMHCLFVHIALRISYSTKIGLPITTHHYPPEDKNYTPACLHNSIVSRK